ncbi:MAG: DUF885 domain-containing protein [Ignavibacteria bacterium]|nr:DUF885 domain-containing protein [Ignavibacteria bacterium]
MNDSTGFGELSREVYLKILEFFPDKGSYLGLHEYDGLIPDISEASINEILTVYSGYLDRLGRIDKSKLTSKESLEYDLCEWHLNTEIFMTTRIAAYRYNPMIYAFMFGQIHGYISRDYAPFEERFRSVVSVIDRVPAILREASLLLNEKLPAILCEKATAFFKGYIDSFTSELPGLMDEMKVSDELSATFHEKKDIAVKSVKDFIELIESRSDPECKDYVLGKDRFMEMLKITDHVEIPFHELKKLGEDELKRLHDRIAELESVHKVEGGIYKIEHEHPSAETLVNETASTLQELVDYIRTKDIVDLPDRLNCIVAEMPEYMKFGFAAMDTAGPYEKSDESFYYVSLPEKDWPEEKIEEWMTQFNYPTLKLISIHEAFPGHYTHFLNAYKNPSDLSKILISYAYVEGWAHYTEEMMIELGYGNSDYKTEIGMLLEALVRCCRYIAAIGIHCEGMSIDEAKKFFVENAFMAEATAEEEAKRGAFDPGYLSYTLGKILLKDLKRKYFGKFGDKRSLKDFHNSVVKLGAPSFRIAERFILSEN